jgi:hypothetical protein
MSVSVEEVGRSPRCLSESGPIRVLTAEASVASGAEGDQYRVYQFLAMHQQPLTADFK